MTMYSYIAIAQQNSSSTVDSLEGFNETAERAYFLSHHSGLGDYNEFIAARKKDYIADKFYPTQKLNVPPPATMTACTNVDFENGTTNGWALSTGYNPAYNATGCCPNAGGAQNIVSGPGTDGCGGFPIVGPYGSYSLMLGNNQTGGIADRIEQTFTVTQANSIYVYRYAVVLEDPGHSPADQPSFQIDMVDASGTQIPCTFYQVSAGQGIPGFQNSATCAGVIYKPWTTVAVDLTNYINQNVTIRFTTYDCALGGHYAYAYIDGSCSTYNITYQDSLCTGGSTQICAPPGFASYTWNGPGVTNQTGQCINVSNPGNYQVQVSTITGCAAPILNVNLNAYPAPVAGFNTNGASLCNLSVSFNNTSTMQSGIPIVSSWDFGDGSTSGQQSPTHTYLNYGTYTVSLIVTAPTGCADTITQTITLNAPPSPTFTTGTACPGTAISFTNTTAGTTTQWQWSFGDGGTSSLQNPSHSYALAGTYNVTLATTAANNCTNSITVPLTVNPAPVAAFTAAPVCQGLNSVFNNTSSVAGGTISSWNWDFTSDGTVDNTNQSPTFTYAAAGSYAVTLSVGSNQNCYSSYTAQVVVYANPLAAFNVQNTCPNVACAFNNTSGIQSPNTISSYLWNFGNGSTSSSQSPAYAYPASGTYNVSLTATSAQGCSNTFNSPITIHPVPNPSFIATVACHNAPTSFTNQSSISSGTISSWEWDFDNNGSVDATTANPTFVYPNAGPYNCKLTATSNNFCAASVLNVTVVNYNPVAAFSSQNVCQGVATPFTDLSTVNGSSISSWAWDFDNNGTVDNTTQNPNYTYAGAGNYTAQLTVTSAQGCSSAISSAVTVLANPTAAFTFTNSCQNTAVAFTNTSSVPSPASITTYQWSFGNGGGSAVQHPSYSYSSAGTFNVSLTATSNQGCTGSSTSPIVIYPSPVANFSSTAVCFNQPTTLTNQSSVSSGSIVSWDWDLDNNGSVDATTANPNYVYPASGNFNCNLKVTTNNGCSASTTLPVVVYANPVAAFHSQSVCLNKAMNFSDHSTSSMGNIIAWNWDFDSDGTIDNISQNPSHTYTSTGTYLVTLEVQTSNGCVTTIQKAVRVNPNPIVNFSAPVQSGCPDLCISFVNNSSISSGTITGWNWNFGDNTAASTLQSPQHCFGTGNYLPTLTAVSDSGCTAVYTATTAVNVFPEPTADFTITSDNGETPDIIDPAVNIIDQSNGASSFQYLISDGSFNDNPTFSHTFSSETEGTYTITQIVSNTFGCKDTISKPVEIKPAYTFYIPNAFSPNEDGKNDLFKGEGIGIQEFNMWIFDRWGNMIFYTNDLDNGWDGKFQGRSDKTVMQDVFVWKVQLKDVFNKKHDLKGTVAVVR